MRISNTKPHMQVTVYVSQLDNIMSSIITHLSYA